MRAHLLWWRLGGIGPLNRAFGSSHSASPASEPPRAGEAGGARAGARTPCPSSARPRRARPQPPGGSGACLGWLTPGLARPSSWPCQPTPYRALPHASPARLGPARVGVAPPAPPGGAGGGFPRTRCVAHPSRPGHPGGRAPGKRRPEGGLGNPRAPPARARGRPGGGEGTACNWQAFTSNGPLSARYSPAAPLRAPQDAPIRSLRVVQGHCSPESANHYL